MTVQDLALQVLSGREEALRELDRRLTGPLIGFLGRKATWARPHEVEELVADIVGEALLALAQGRYDPSRARFLTYTFGVAKNKLARRRRNPPRERPFTALSGSGDGVSPDDFPAPSPGDFEAIERIEAIEAMRDCLYRDGKLSPLEQRVVIGRACEESFDTLARELGRSKSTIHAWHQKALEKLRRCLKAKGVTG